MPYSEAAPAHTDVSVSSPTNMHLSLRVHEFGRLPKKAELPKMWWMWRTGLTSALISPCVVRESGHMSTVWTVLKQSWRKVPFVCALLCPKPQMCFHRLPILWNKTKHWQLVWFGISRIPLPALCFLSFLPYCASHSPASLGRKKKSCNWFGGDY